MFFRKIIYSKTKPLMNSNEYSIILWNGEKNCSRSRGYYMLI